MIQSWFKSWVLWETVLVNCLCSDLVIFFSYWSGSFNSILSFLSEIISYWKSLWKGSEGSDIISHQQYHFNKENATYFSLYKIFLSCAEWYHACKCSDIILQYFKCSEISELQFFMVLRLQITSRYLLLL